VSLSPSEARLAYGLLFLTPLLFSANALTARWVGDTLPPVAMAFWRWTLTLVFLFPYAGRQFLAGWRDLAREWRVLLLLGSLGMGLCGAPVYIGARTTGATNIGLIYAMTPILIVVISWLGWRETVTRRQVLGIAVAPAGVLAIVARGDPRFLLDLDFVPGDLFILAATTSWALYSVVLKQRPGRQPMAARFVAIVIAGVLVMLPFYGIELALGERMPLDGRTLAVLLILALVSGIGAFLAYGKLVVMVGPQRTGLLLYLGPIYNGALAWLLLGERLEAYHFAGTALILGGVALATVARPARGS
jgi:drug/metabolite transporter (DMT)-like permease